ncbi:STAS domain-containing protein [Nonomuraea thailandensis]
MPPTPTTWSPPSAGCGIRAALVLDLGALTFMDSTGLHVLLRVHRQVRQDGGSFHLAAVRDLPARLLQITEVWDALDIHPSTDAAIAALSSAFGPTTRLERPSCG